MTEQLSLLDPRRLARRSDPETSHDGAVSIVADLPRLQREALALVRANPNRTASELSQIAGHTDPRRINRRLGELEERGALIRGDARPCSVSGRLAHAWRAVA